MPSSRSRQNPPRLVPNALRSARRTATVCIVDPQADDYVGCQSLAQAHAVELKLVATAEQALRLARTESIDLWVVSTTLTGKSGCELCGMLKSNNPQTAVYLVAESHSPEVEQAAWRARPTMFGVKGEQSALLTHWLNHRAGRQGLASVAAVSRN